MRVDLECSCGAKLTLAFTPSTRYDPSHEQAQAEKLSEQFRRDHKNCRVMAWTKEDE